MQKAARHYFAQCAWVAADGDFHVARFLDIPHAMRPRHARREKFRVRDFLVQLHDANGLFVTLLRELAALLLGQVLLFKLIVQLSLAFPRRLALAFQLGESIRMGLFVFVALRLLRLGLRQFNDIHIAPHAALGFIHRRRSAKKSGHRVIVALCDRIKLVVVAARAANRHAKERLARFLELLIDDVHMQLRLVGLDNLDVAQHEKAGRHQVRRAFHHRLVRQQVAGNLLANEPVEWLVVVVSVDDVIAIAPRVLGEDIVRGADLVRVSHKVQPMPRPPFAKRLRSQQPVDYFLTRLRRLVRLKHANLLHRWRQSGKVKTHPPPPSETI